MWAELVSGPYVNLGMRACRHMHGDVWLLAFQARSAVGVETRGGLDLLSSFFSALRDWSRSVSCFWPFHSPLVSASCTPATTSTDPKRQIFSKSTSAKNHEDARSGEKKRNVPENKNIVQRSAAISSSAAR